MKDGLNDEDGNRTSGVDGGAEDAQILSALSDWPHLEPSAADADAFVTAVTAAIEARASLRDADDDAIFAPPLPVVAGVESAANAEPVDNADTVPDSRVDRKPSFEAVAAVAAFHEPPEPEEAPVLPFYRRRAGFVRGLVGSGVIAVAASVFFVVTTRSAQAPSSSTSAVAARPGDPSSTADTPPVAVPAAPIGAASTTPPDDDPETATRNQLAAELGGKKQAIAAKSPPKSKAGANAADDPHKTPTGSKSLSKGAAHPKPSPKVMTKEAMAKADPIAVEDEPKLASMDIGGSGNATTQGAPQKPSAGAVQGAIGAVLPAARACVTAQEPVSRATVTFASTGAVRDVQITGDAAGKPAETCIRGALAKARVAPFAEASYGATITVRP